MARTSTPARYSREEKVQNKIRAASLQKTLDRMRRDSGEYDAGAADARAVFAGGEPSRDPQQIVTKDYRDGWEDTVAMLLEVFPGSEVIA